MYPRRKRRTYHNGSDYDDESDSSEGQTPCPYCGETYCDNGSKCDLPRFLKNTEVRDAINRVQAIDDGFQSQGFGPRFWDGKRPRPLPRVWEHVHRNYSDPFFCPYCKKKRAKSKMQVDHKVPWKQYIEEKLPGERSEKIPLFIARALGNDPDNLEGVCSSCNVSKGDWDTSVPAFSGWVASRSHTSGGGTAVPPPTRITRRPKKEELEEKRREEEKERERMRRKEREEREERHRRLFPQH